jgi:hypothetical protein
MKTFSFLFFIGFYSLVQAQSPTVYIDLDKGDRSESEVTEPGYIRWPIVTSTLDSLTVDGVKFKFKGDFTNDWYKAGLQTPYYARLVSDALVSPGVDLIISGLATGTHTLLTYHNTVTSSTGVTFSPVDIYVNGNLVVDNLTSSNRVTVNSDAATAFFSFNATAGTDVVITFQPDPSTVATWNKVAINGFALNVSNLKDQATQPYPDDANFHVNADNDTVILRWLAAEGTASHDVYFGTDYSSVAAATTSSALWKGNQTDTFYTIKGFYSMQKYYWRIDEHSSSGKITKGNIWSFQPRHLAFPGAEGYGRFAIGGRGGKVVEVTNLNDSGPGSLREAVTNDIGPRTIVFTVSGIITLKSRLTLAQDYVTVAGQTAPGKGICIRSAPFGLSGADDCVVRFMRVRLGAGITYDGMGLNGCDYAIIDHSSISWTIDEAFSSRSGKNITLQRTFISEALNVAGHQNYSAGTAHGYAASISGDIGSFHHNLLAHCYGRNWSLAGGLDGNGYYAGRLDIFNNVVYNWGTRSTDGGAHEVNFVNNYYKPGPSTSMKYALNAQYDNFPGTQRYYFSGNVMPGVFDETTQTKGRKYSGTPNGYSPWADSSFFPSYAETQTAGEAYKQVLSDVGCNQPVFDDHDIRVVKETLLGSYTYKGSASGLRGLPDNQSDVGGWENYPEMKRDTAFDSDHDGLPNWWEKLQGLNPYSSSSDFSDANADNDLNGYTQMEEYLAWMAEPHYFIGETDSLVVKVKDLARGYASQPKFTVTSPVNGSVTLRSSDTCAVFRPALGGLASFSFIVTDSENSSFLRKVGIYVGNVQKDTVYIADTTHTPVDSVTNPTDSSTVDLNTVAGLSVNCFPNPASHSVYIQIPVTEVCTVNVSLHSLTGTCYQHKSFVVSPSETLIKLDLTQIPAGLYYITITNNKQTIQTTKLLKI